LKIAIADMGANLFQAEYHKGEDAREDADTHLARRSDATTKGSPA
jgi:hypothetical protein